MLTNEFIRYVNNTILNEASKLRFIVKDNAPNSENDLWCPSGELVIWSGASDRTIFNDAKVNYAFRALHDVLHIKTGLGFNPIEEIELGRIQANQYDGLLSDLIYIEVSEQSKYYLTHCQFVSDQVLFTQERMKEILK